MASRSLLAGLVALTVALLLYLFVRSAAQVEDIKNATHAHSTVERMTYSAGSRPRASTDSYVSLVANDDLVLAGRVLGRSIKRTKTQKDMVMMVTASVSDANVALLEKAGWRVLYVPMIDNPFLDFEAAKPEVLEYAARSEWSRKWAIYCKLHIFHMTEYKRIYYLDADAIMLRNTDSIFECGEDLEEGARFFVCGTARVGDHMMYSVPHWSVNAGVILVRPDEEIYNDIVTHFAAIGTNRNMGDQGLLQKYLFFVCRSNQLLGQQNVTALLEEFPDETIRLTMDGWVGWRKRNQQNRSVGQVARDGTVCEEGNKKTCRTPENLNDYRMLPRVWPPGVPPQHIDDRPRPVDLLPASAGCFEVPREYNFKVTDPQLEDLPFLAHYAGPQYKPWNWRMAMYGSFWGLWFEIANELQGPLWRDSFPLAFSLCCLPLVLAYSLYHLMRGSLFRMLDLTLASWCGVRRSAPFLGGKLVHSITLYVSLPATTLILLYTEATCIFYIYSALPSRIYPLLGWIAFLCWTGLTQFVCTLLVCLLCFIHGRLVATPGGKGAGGLPLRGGNGSENMLGAGYKGAKDTALSPWAAIGKLMIKRMSINALSVILCWIALPALIVQWESLGEGADTVLLWFATLSFAVQAIIQLFYQGRSTALMWMHAGQDVRSRRAGRATNHLYDS